MKPKKAIKELRKQLKGDQGNVVVKIRLASLLRDVGEFGEAVRLYLEVAQSYHASDRLGQAIAVCRGILEFAPSDPGTHQMLAYLDQVRQLSEAAEEEAASPVPSVGRYASPPADELRRKRPTSFPTPLSRRDSSSLPGLPSTPGRGSRSLDSDVSDLATGPRRNSRPSETGHTLSNRRVDADVTVPGAPPTRPTNEFKLRDLSAAGSSRLGETGEHERTFTKRTLPRIKATATLPFASAKPAKSSGPPPPPKGQNIATGAHTVPRRQSNRPTFQPPDLAPAPTPVPDEMRSPPPLPDHAEPMEETYEPGLEDATIVDPNFDMAKFILAQTVEEVDTNDVDLPEIPVLATAKKVPQQGAQEVTRVADTEPSGVSIDSFEALRRLPDYALKALAAGATENVYPTGYMILSEGDASDTCYLVVSGEVQVLKRDPLKGGSTTSMATLGPGAVVGEYALVGDRRCLASVQTTRPSTVVELSRASIVGLTTRFPALRSSLELLYREILIETLMSSSRVFRVLSPAQWPEVVGLFEPVRASAGQKIIEEGQRFGGFYLVLTGEVSVAGAGRGPIRGLGAGFYVGEVSMLKGEMAHATVTAETSVEFARLDARRFYALVAGNEELWAHIWRESQRPELVDLQLVAGVAANV